jgi:F-type H+-transporting ATPase subunit epsilon
MELRAGGSCLEVVANTIRCDIVSAQEQIFSGEVAHVVVAGSSGEMGIYPQHTPLMSTLKPGTIRVVFPDGTESTFFIGGGIVEVMPHLVTVLADTAIRAVDLDEEAAQRAREGAEKELHTRAAELDIAEAMAKLAKALAQLRALEELRRRLRH